MKPRLSILKSTESKEEFECEEYSSETEADQAQRESIKRTSWEPHEMFRSRGPSEINPDLMRVGSQKSSENSGEARKSSTKRSRGGSPGILKKPSLTSTQSFPDSVFENNDESMLKPNDVENNKGKNPSFSEKPTDSRKCCIKSTKDFIIIGLGVLILLLTASNIWLGLKSTSNEGLSFYKKFRFSFS